MVKLAILAALALLAYLAWHTKNASTPETPRLPAEQVAAMSDEELAEWFAAQGMR